MFSPYMKYQVRDWLAVQFLRGLMRFKGAQGYACRACGQRLHPGQIVDVLKTGCPVCQGTKLAFVYAEVTT